MMMTPGLAEFLAVRLDEDEATARQALLAQPISNPRYPAGGEMITSAIALSMLHSRHDPARVLREVAAKRAILAAWLDNERERDDALSYTDGLADGLGLSLVYLGAAWSDHPDYRPEWAPDGG